MKNSLASWSVAVLASLALAGCVPGGVKEEGESAQTAAQPEGQPPVEAAQASAQQASQDAAQESSMPAPGSLRGISNQLDRLSGRLVLLQEQVIKLGEASRQQAEREQMILSHLQLATETGQSAQPAAGNSAADTSGASQQLDAAIGQLMSVMNNMSSNAGGGDYQIATTYTAKGDWLLLRYRIDTGETWLADGGMWVPLQEMGTLPASHYRVLVSRADQDLKGYVAVRIDEQTGDSWWLSDKLWKPYP